MTLNTMQRCVLQAGYSANIGNGVIAQVLDGGAPRFRRALKGTVHSGNVSWTLNANGYQYLMAFYRVWARNPNQPFLIDLCIDNGVVEPYEAFFDGSPSLTAKNGNLFSVSATLIVKPLVSNDAMDDLIVGVANQGVSFIELTQPLEELVNEDLPNAIGGFDG